MLKENKTILLLRFALAFAFLYAAVSGFIEPNAWIGFFPTFLTKIIPAFKLLLFFEIVEILLAFAILFLKNPFYPALLSALMLLGIIIFNLSQLNVLFRDISIAIMAVALAIHFKEETYPFKKQL